MNRCYIHGENHFEVRKTREKLLGGGINHPPPNEHLSAQKQHWESRLELVRGGHK